MPKDNSRRLQGRNPLPESQVKSPGLKVYSNPTDPYEQAFEDKSAAETLKALSQFVQGVGQVGGLAATHVREDAERQTAKAVGIPGADGIQHKAKGEPGLLGQIFSEAYRRGYDKIDGEFVGSQYKREIETLYATKKDLDKAQFDMEAAALREKYIQSMVSDEQLDGFLAKAVKAEEDTFAAHSAYQVALVQSKLKEKTSAVMRNAIIDEVVGPALKAMGINDVSELKTLDGMQKFQQGIAIWKNEASPQLHAMLARFHRELKDTMNRGEVSELFVSIMTQIAGDGVTPEFLDFTKIPDGDKMTVRDRNNSKGNPLGPEILSAEKALYNQRTTFLNQLEETKNRMDKEAFYKASSEWVLDASLLWEKDEKDYPAALLDLELRYKKISGMDGVHPGQVAELEAILNTKKNRNRHPPASDKKAVDDFFMRFQFGKVDVGYVTSRWLSFDEKDYNRFLEMASRQTASRNEKDADKRDAYFTPKKMVEEAYHELERTVNPSDPLGTGKLDTNGYVNAAEAREMFRRKVYEWSSENGWNSPKAEDLRKIVAEVGAKYPPVLAPDAKSYDAALKELNESEGGMPKTVEEFKKRYNSLTMNQRYVVANELKNGLRPRK